MPYLDGFACTVSISAQWMLSRKCIGTWLCWLIADSVFLCFYAIQGYYVMAFICLYDTGNIGMEAVLMPH